MPWWRKTRKPRQVGAEDNSKSKICKWKRKKYDKLWYTKKGLARVKAKIKGPLHLMPFETNIMGPCESLRVPFTSWKCALNFKISWQRRITNVCHFAAPILKAYGKVIITRRAVCSLELGNSPFVPHPTHSKSPLRRAHTSLSVAANRLTNSLCWSKAANRPNRFHVALHCVSAPILLHFQN